MASHAVTGNPGKSRKLKTVNTRISEELHAAIVAKSEATGVSYAHVIRRALEAWVWPAGGSQAYGDGVFVEQKWSEPSDTITVTAVGAGGSDDGVATFELPGTPVGGGVGVLVKEESQI